MSSNLITVVCFGPGLPAAGCRSSAAFDGDVLVLHLGQDRNERIAVDAIEVAAGGFDHQQMLLSWHTTAGHWSAMPADGFAQSGLLAAAPIGLKTKLGRWNRRTRGTRARFRAGFVALGLIVAAPVLLAAVFLWQADRIAAWAVDTISIETEQKFGAAAFAQGKAGMTFIEGEAQAAVADIGARLTQGSAYQFHWYVVQDPSVNAFAMPGGYVVVHSGLIEAADSAEEVAGVLAHEVQHVERRHSLKGIVHRLGWQAVLGLALGDVTGGAWGDIAAELGNLKFSRDQESDADLQGLAALHRAGIAPQGMVSFFQKLSRQDGATIELLSSHPTSEARFAVLEQAIATRGDWPSKPLAYDWVKLKASLRHATVK